MTSLSGSQSERKESPQNWEYRAVERKLSEKDMNELGAQGWELAAVAGGGSGATAAGSSVTTLYFKRKKM
jgi:ribosomal protein L12E/L44/L45/RPP1/RPP2